MKRYELGMEALKITYDKVIVCKKCKGIGSIVEYNDMGRCYDKITCPVCGGKRVLIKIVHVCYERVKDDKRSGE